MKTVCTTKCKLQEIRSDATPGKVRATPHSCSIWNNKICSVRLVRPQLLKQSTLVTELYLESDTLVLAYEREDTTNTK